LRGASFGPWAYRLPPAPSCRALRCCSEMVIPPRNCRTGGVRLNRRGRKSLAPYVPDLGRLPSAPLRMSRSSGGQSSMADKGSFARCPFETCAEALQRYCLERAPCIWGAGPGIEIVRLDKHNSPVSMGNAAFRAAHYTAMLSTFSAFRNQVMPFVKVAFLVVSPYSGLATLGRWMRKALVARDPVIGVKKTRAGAVAVIGEKCRHSTKETRSAAAPMGAAACPATRGRRAVF